MTDWGAGHDERTAAELHPAAVRVVGAPAGWRATSRWMLVRVDVA